MALGMWDPRGSRQDLRSTGGQGAPTGITGGGSLGIDSSDLKTLHDRLGDVIADVGKLDAAVKKLAGSLGTAGQAWGGISGGKAVSAGGGNLSTASFGTPVSFGGASKAPIIGAGGGTNGNRNTSAPVSAFGGGGAATRMIALGAMGEVGARMAGGINSGISTITSAGMATDTMASQSVGIFGGGTKAGSVNGMTGFQNQGSNDLNKAMATLMSNPMLFPAIKQGSQQQRGLQGFMNTLQKLNPTMSAAGAAGTANQLVSGPTLQALQRLGARRGQLGQGLINPTNMNVNDPSRVFSEMMQAVTGGKQLSARQMRTQYGSGAQATRNWTMIGQNNNVPGMGLGLSPQMLTELRQYAAAGGNLSAAEQAQAGTVAGSALFKSTAKTKFQETTFQKTSGSQIAENKAAGDFYNILTRLTADSGPLPNLVAGAASAAKYLLSIGSHVAGAAVLAKGASTLFHGGGGLLSTGATDIMGGGTGGGPPTPTGSNQQPLVVRTDPAAPFVVTISADSLAKFCGCAGGGGKKTTTAHKVASSGLNLGKAVSREFWKGPGGALGDLFHKVTGINIPGAGPSAAGESAVLGDPPTGSTTTAGMTPTMSGRMTAMMKANPALKISSGHRTAQQQKNLYAMKGGRGVARPGHSAHQMGKAADIGPPSQFKWIAKNAQKFGLYTPAPSSEPWHVQAMGDPTPANGSAATGAQVVSAAQGALGTPYVWGGESTKGYDCSGLVQAVYAKVGINLPRTSQQQASAGKAVGGLSQAQPGDLILYNEPGEGPNSHVAIYIGGGKQIAAPHTGTVVQVQGVDTAHISTIRRIVSGGAGQGVVAAAQGAVGSASSDATKHSGGGGGKNIGLGNNFLSMVKGLGGMQGSPGGGGGGTSSNSGAGASVSSSAGTGATGSTAILSSTGGSIAGPTQFSQAVLAGLGVKSTVTDVTNINAWQQAEGQWGASGAYNAKVMHDPLNTKLPEPGSSSLGGLTNSYPSWAEGIAATVSTIKQGNMAPIFSSLKANASLSAFSKALESTGWAQSSYGGRGFPEPSGMYAVGDPSTSFTPSGGGMGGGMASFSAHGHGGGNIYLSMPIQMSDGSSGDASRFANQVVDAIERRTGMKMVQES